MNWSRHVFKSTRKEEKQTFLKIRILFFLLKEMHRDARGWMRAELESSDMITLIISAASCCS